MTDTTTEPSAGLGGAKANIPWRLITARETADLLGLSLRQVRTYIKDGYLPVRYIGERSPRIDIHELYDWFQAQSPVAPTSANADVDAAATAA